MRARLAQWFLMTMLAGTACTSARETPAPPSPAEGADVLTPETAIHACGRLTLGAPIAVCVSFEGGVVVVDASPPRLMSYAAGDEACQEFQQPDGSPAFRPSDVSIRGFFVYAVDETNRMLLRWDSSGSYRDVLVNFEELDPARRVSPYGLDVDKSGRVAVTDVENHRVFVFDTYLKVNVAFGDYGSFDGQLDAPGGVSFTPLGDLLVADTGNARLQVFTDSGSHRRTIPGAGADNPMQRPRRAVAAEDGTMYVADPAARRVFVIAPDGTVVRAFVADALLPFEPTDVALARDGRLYVTDAASKTLYAFRVM